MKFLLSVLMCTILGMSLFSVLTLSISIILAASPTSKIIQHDLSLLNNAAPLIRESPSLNEIKQSLNNGLQNLSLFNATAIMIMIIVGSMSLIFLLFGKFINELKLITKLSESSTIAIALLFGLMVLFYTSADLTNLSQEQTIVQTLTIIMPSEKNHDQQIKLLGDFIMDKIGQYRINVESSLFFGLMTLTVVINLFLHKIKSESIVPYIMFFVVIGSVLLWVIGFMTTTDHSQPFVSCTKVHC